MVLDELLSRRESESLDFKKEFHSSNVKLLHDILCLANSYHDGDRFLIFGVSDDATVNGVENDQNRKTNANIQDLLRQSNLDRIPTIGLDTYVHQSGHEVDVLSITNRPDKPFFVTKDKSHQGNILRAGVVYTRLGDTNTPMGESAPEANIELMWRERFGFDLAPLDLASRLLEEPDQWEKVEEDNYLYHRFRPEFTIQDGRTLVENFREPWSQSFPDSTAQSFEVCLYYLTTLLRKFVFVHCDGFRYRIPLPQRKGSNGYWIDTNSIAWKIAQIYTQYYPLPDSLQSHNIHLV